MPQQTVLTPKGFVAAGLHAGIREGEGHDLALIVNQGPAWNAAAVFPDSRVCASPVRATREVMRSHAVNAVVLTSGNANAFNGSTGDADTREIQKRVSQEIGVPEDRVAVCAKGQFAVPLPMERVKTGLARLATDLGDTPAHAESAAAAIASTQGTINQAGVSCGAWSVGGISQGAGNSQETLDTVLGCLTTDALVPAFSLEKALRRAMETTFNTLDRSTAPLTNDTVLLLASGASQVTPNQTQLDEAVLAVCEALVEQLLVNQGSATKKLTLAVAGAANDEEARIAAQAVACDGRFRESLLSGAPDWPRALAIAGKTKVCLDAEALEINVNGTQLCQGITPLLTSRVLDYDEHVTITLDLGTRGVGTATVRTLLEPM